MAVMRSTTGSSFGVIAKFSPLAKTFDSAGVSSQSNNFLTLLSWVSSSSVKFCDRHSQNFL